MQSFLLRVVAIGAAATLPAYAAAHACCEPDSPFVLGEGFPVRLATCDTIGTWIDRAPDYEGRITLSIEGELTAIDRDGSLAYLVMCRDPGVQVMCVTYSREGREPGETVVFAGGYQRVGDRHVMLDPCLVSVRG